MKKIIASILLLLIGATITTLEISAINHAKEEDFVWIVATQNDLPAGYQINAKDLMLVSIPKALETQYYYSSISELEGMTLNTDVGKGVILSAQMLRNSRKHVPEKGKAITAVKLAPEEILCWQIENGDVINLVAVDVENGLIELGEFTIKGVYYQDSNTESKYENSPVFILVEGKKEQIKSIIKHRGNRKIEGIKVGS